MIHEEKLSITGAKEGALSAYNYYIRRLADVTDFDSMDSRWVEGP